MNGVGLLLTVALVAPTPSPPPPTIVHVRTTPQCTYLHEDVAPGVGALLRNDVSVLRAGDAVHKLLREIQDNDWDDSPYGDLGIAFAQVRISQLANTIEGNVERMRSALGDPAYRDVASQPQLSALRASLEDIANQQGKILNLLYALGYSGHPTMLTWYPDPVQDQIRAVAKTQKLPADIFSAIATIANENIAKTQALETVAASDITKMASSCGDKITASAPASSAQALPATSQLKPLPQASPLIDTPSNRNARAFYNELVDARIDRVHLSAALNAELTPSFLETVSQQLSFLGTPQWTEAGTRSAASGVTAYYRLSYSNGMALYYGYGSAGGTVFDLFIGTQLPGTTAP